jgi:hypothetical protein
MATRPALFALLVALAAGCSAPSAPAGKPAPAPPPAVGQWLGAGSCASAGCHNANGLKGELRSEYTTWVLHDKHARAYEVLLNKRSKDIIQKLNPDDKTPAPADQRTLCLNCHVHQDYDVAQAGGLHNAYFSREDGVSCESCHGPASGWISEHFRPQWRTLDVSAKRAREMWDTQSLPGRAERCATCHVGAKGMEVDHDLIAAGHPRLAFEFAAYHSLMPHHWQDAKDKVRHDNWDAVAWFVGQAMAARAAVEQLRRRADRVNAKGLWPEFTEYDCYACHHQLQHQSWRIDRGYDKRKAGQLPWSDWYVSPLPYELHPDQKQATEVLAKIASLKEAMEDRIVSDAAKVADAAKALNKALDDWATACDKANYPAEDVRKMLKRLVERGAEKDAPTWDAATQAYLAVAALYVAGPVSKGPNAPAWRTALKGIRCVLDFESDTQSPQRRYTPALVKDGYALLRDLLPR